MKHRTLEQYRAEQKRIREDKLNRLYKTLYKRQEKGATMPQLAAWHHVSQTTIHRRMFILYKTGNIEVKANYWFYKPAEPTEVEAPKPVADEQRKEIEDEHTRLLSSERSPRLEDFENYYRGKAGAAGKIRSVPKMASLSFEEREHVIKHLQIL